MNTRTTADQKRAANNAANRAALIEEVEFLVRCVLVKRRSSPRSATRISHSR